MRLHIAMAKLPLVVLLGGFPPVTQPAGLAPPDEGTPEVLATAPFAHAISLPLVAHDGTVAERFVGQYVGAFETSAFTSCDGTPWNRAWLQSEDDTFFTRYYELVEESGANPLEGLTVLVEVTARLELAKPGELGFGHLGQYRAQLTVEKLLDMTLDPCPGP